MNKIIFKLKKKLLLFHMLFGQKKYMNYLVRLYSKIGVTFEGMPKYIDRSVQLDCFSKGRITIGEGSVIACGTCVLTHDYSIDCGLIAINKNNEENESVFYKDVKKEKNVFIGQRSIVLPGVTIGDNCIVGSGTIVSKNIPNDSVVVGSPCRIIANTKEWAMSKLNDPHLFAGNKRVKYDKK